jgi:hypothetical protein
MKYINYPRSKSRVHNVCALVAASLILPAMAFADRDHDRDNVRDEQRGGDATGMTASQLYLRQTQGGC